jgi:hypothetical protein
LSSSCPAGTDKTDETPGDNAGFCGLWSDHFHRTMKPRHIPTGWMLVTVRNLNAVEVYGTG